MEQKNTSLLNRIFMNAQPKTIFFGGIVVALLVLCTIGFFILLGMFVSGDVGQNRGQAQKVGAAVPQPNPSVPPTANNIQLTLSEDDWYKGAKDAAITIVEFSDLECPFCKRFHETMQQVVDNYGDNVKWVYRHFPLTSLHRNAFKEAEATECAGELGGNEGFWAYTDRLFKITPSNDGLDLAQLPQIAQDVGINRSAFESCLNSGRHAEKVQAHADQAIATGGRGTPHSIIVAGDQLIPINGAQPYEQVKSILDSLLQ